MSLRGVHTRGGLVLASIAGVYSSGTVQLSAILEIICATIIGLGSGCALKATNAAGKISRATTLRQITTNGSDTPSKFGTDISLLASPSHQTNTGRVSGPGIAPHIAFFKVPIGLLINVEPIKPRIPVQTFFSLVSIRDETQSFLQSGRNIQDILSFFVYFLNK